MQWGFCNDIILLSKGPNSHAQKHCILGVVVILRSGGTLRLLLKLQCPKCAKVGRAQSERKERGSSAAMLGLLGRFRGAVQFLESTEAEWWCFGDGEVEDKPVG